MEGSGRVHKVVSWKRIIIILIVMLFLFYLVVFTGKLGTMAGELESTDTISIVNGNTGERTEVTDQQVINEILSNLEEVRCFRKLPLARGGYNYYFDFLSEGSAIARITFFDDGISIDDTDYFTASSIDIDQIVKLAQ